MEPKETPDIDRLFGGEPLPAPSSCEPPAQSLPARVSKKKNNKKPSGASAASHTAIPKVSLSAMARYKVFITAYLKDTSNQSAAYRKAYPNASASASHSSAGTLLRHPWVQAEIARRVAGIEKRADISIGEIVRDLAKIKDFDVRKLYAPVLGDDGEPALNTEGKPRMRRLEPWELDDDTAAALDGLKLKDTKFGLAIEYKAAGKINALEILGRYKGMLKDPEKPPIIANIQINF